MVADSTHTPSLHRMASSQTTGTTATRGAQSILMDPTNPATILYDRFLGWSEVVAQIQNTFVNVENHYRAISKEWSRLCRSVEMPIKNAPGLSGDGVAKLWRDLHDQSFEVARTHDEVADQVRRTPTGELDDLQRSIKQKLKLIKSYQYAGNTKDVERVRKITLNQLESLGKVIALQEASPGTVSASEDPYIIHRNISRQMEFQVDAENGYNSLTVGLHKECEALEKRIVWKIRESYDLYSDFLCKSASALHQASAIIQGTSASINNDHEWVHFTGQSGVASCEEMSRKGSDVDWPNKHHPLTQPVRYGHLFYRTMLKTFKNIFVVVTPSGYMHIFENANAMEHVKPDFSLYVPSCRVVSPALESNQAKFSLFGHKAKGLIGADHKFTFKAASYPEAERWCRDLLSVRSKLEPMLISTSAFTRSENIPRNYSRNRAHNVETRIEDSRQLVVKTEGSIRSGTLAADDSGQDKLSTRHYTQDNYGGTSECKSYRMNSSRDRQDKLSEETNIDEGYASRIDYEDTKLSPTVYSPSVNHSAPSVSSTTRAHIEEQALASKRYLDYPDMTSSQSDKQKSTTSNSRVDNSESTNSSTRFIRVGEKLDSATKQQSSSQSEYSSGRSRNDASKPMSGNDAETEIRYLAQSLVIDTNQPTIQTATKAAYTTAVTTTLPSRSSTAAQDPNKASALRKGTLRT